MIARFFLGLIALLITLSAGAETIDLFDGRTLASIIHEDSHTAALVADLLARDMAALTGKRARVSDDLSQCGPLCIVIGSQNAPLISAIASQTGADLSALTGQWETYHRVALHAGATTYLLIAGSDPRGTVWGVIDLTREMGISAWEWWADVVPRKVDRLSVEAGEWTSAAPSVTYRGIFLNDEDWGLEPWAAKTYDSATGNLGPRTYARIFELMWRLKANTIWPAMHSVSAPFFGDPSNPRMAADYAIVIGTSHAEPIMRNNLREWDPKIRGDFNFLTNAEGMAAYWRERAEESRPFESIYTVGLRGIHDGPMQGAVSADERKSVLQKAVSRQRSILGQALNRPEDQIPQAFTVYKEVEEAYDAGLSLPDDVTLVWCDDNYGYLGRLSTPAEARRSGGAGVYYHISYWGQPHDYLWLATTHPGLIREEMGRAYSTNARREWILNVGDIKPGEYLTQYFLDLAFDARLFDRNPKDHLTDWLGRQFGTVFAPEIADIMMGYYDLAFERKPEFMGWGQTEPVTPNHFTDYIQSDGEEAQSRLAAYETLRRRAEAVARRIPTDRRDAFFQLVLYPVRASASLNERILTLDLADLYARQQRASANFYAARARRAQARLTRDTASYNRLSGGKWHFMMDDAPRNLPVFDRPIYPHWSESLVGGCSAAYSGQWANDSNSLMFTEGWPSVRTVTLFGRQNRPLDWRSEQIGPSLALSAVRGRLGRDNGFEQRLKIAYDGGPAGGGLRLRCGDRTLDVPTVFLPKAATSQPVEDNRIISIAVTSAPANPAWERIDQLGSEGSLLRSRLDLTSIDPGDALSVSPSRPPLVYRFSSRSSVSARLRIVALPTHPLTPLNGLRLGVSLDNGPIEVLDFATIGRSDEWRANVLANAAMRSIDLRKLPAGEHHLAVYPVDPGLLLDRIEIDLDGAVSHYGSVRYGR